jgi:hypothetical protein
MLDQQQQERCGLRREPGPAGRAEELTAVRLEVQAGRPERGFPGSGHPHVFLIPSSTSPHGGPAHRPAWLADDPRSLDPLREASMTRPSSLPDPSRRHFVHSVGLMGLFPLLAAPGIDPVTRLASRSLDTAKVEPLAFPRNDLERVSTVVGAAHSNIDVVRTLVTEQPALAKASWDWGFGDWETPLGAASHVGRREIAEFLIGHGARPTIFSAAMMGQVDTVRAFLEADPALFTLHGPHGISLMRHAQAGRDDATAVGDYLLDRFGPDEAPFGFPGDDGIEARYGGRFRFPGEPDQVLVTGVVNGWLMMGFGERPSGRVLPVAGETDVFHPTGAPAVRLRFHVEEGRTARLTVEDGPVALVGTRIPD